MSAEYIVTNVALMFRFSAPLPRYRSLNTMKLAILIAAAVAATASPLVQPEVEPRKLSPTQQCPRRVKREGGSELPSEPDLELKKRRPVRWIKVTATPVKSGNNAKTSLNCRAAPWTTAQGCSYYWQGHKMKVACQVIGEVVHGQNIWLRVDPGPTMPWCYVSAHFTDYVDWKQNADFCET